MNPIVANQVPRVFLKAGREAPLEGFHPWVFSGAVQKVDPCEAGDLVRVFGADKRFFGVGFISPTSQILVRMVAFGEAGPADETAVNAEFFERRIANAAKLRTLPAVTNAYRVVNAEGDFLPGLVIDRYGDTVVLQVHLAGMDRRKNWIVAAVQKILSPKVIYEKSDTETRQKEGLAPSGGVIWRAEGAGSLGDRFDPSPVVTILENGYRFDVDVVGGQKTGFFLDQRENRERVGRAAAGRRVLNAFCYTGGFSVYAAKGGASQVVSVDLSREALEQGKKNYAANGLAVREADWVCADVFDFLRKSDGEGLYSLIVLDPPAFCKRREDVPAACRGYKDINLQALKKCASGALLFTFSCSSHMDAELFRKVVFGAAKDSGRQVRVIGETSHPADHPVSLYHPEGRYLKGLILAVE